MNVIHRSLVCLVILTFAANGTVVTTLVDEDDGLLGGNNGISLREAVSYSTPRSIISFDPVLSGQIIRLTRGQILISKSLTIDASSLSAPIVISGDKTGDGRTGDDTRVLQVNSTVSPVVLDSLVIADGYAASSPGIYINTIPAVATTVKNCMLVRNFAYGGSSIGGAISCGLGPATILNTTVSDNYTSGPGGGIFAAGNLTIRNSRVSANYGYANGGGIFVDAGDALIEDSTIAGNSTNSYGGGLHLSSHSGSLTVNGTSFVGNSALNGAGIYNDGKPVTLNNCTFTLNAAVRMGGGIYHYNNTLKVNNCTITGNTAGSSSGGGGIFNTLALTLKNSIVAGNSSNIIPSSSRYSAIGNNLVSGPPLLAPLGDYGGPTQTMPPLLGSTAINAGGDTSLATDQRGLQRIDAPDIGASEYQGPADIARFWNLDFDGDGTPYGVEQALGTLPLNADSTDSRNLTAPEFSASGQAVLSFGLNPAAIPGTRWILSRSPDLSPGSFQEIYRFDGISDTPALGISFSRDGNKVTITDAPPLLGQGFYRFATTFNPPP